MKTALDHLVLSCTDLEKAAPEVEARLGAALSGVGLHAAMGTHNRLVGLGADYLELIAVNPQAPAPGRPRWFDLDRFAGPVRLTNWVLACDDLDAALALAPAGTGRPMDFARGPYRWRMAVPDDGRLPFDGCFPALIEWQGPSHPAQALPESGLRLVALRLTHPRPADLSSALAPLLHDGRISIQAGPFPRLSADFDGPGGRITL